MLVAGGAADQWLAEVKSRSPAEARTVLTNFFRAATTIVAIMIVGYSLHLFRVGHRIVTSERFPPKDMAVIRDTRVLEGRPARIRGLVLKGLSLALFIAAIALPFYAYYVTALLAY